MSTKRTPAAREIGLIKMGQAKLGWDDGTYRAAIAAQCGGKTSATQLTWQERQKLIAYMNRHGAEIVSRQALGRADSTMGKLRAIWYALADKNAVMRPETPEALDQAIEAWAKRMHPGLDAIRFASPRQMQMLIEAAKKWALRVGAATE